MSTREEVRLDLMEGHTAAGEAEWRSLIDWLRADAGLSVRSSQEPISTGDMGSDETSLIVTLSGEARSVALLIALFAWLRSQRSGITVRVSAGDRTVELQSGAEVPERDRLFQQWQLLLVLEPLPKESANYALRWKEPLQQATSSLIRSQPEYQLDVETSTIPVTIYLSAGENHQEVERAVEDLLATAGLRIESRDDPVIGSWFRRMLAAAKEAIHSPRGSEVTLAGVHVVDTRLVLAQDAAVTATLLQNVGPVITSLQNTKDAVIRAGALLIVKVDWTVTVLQLTAAQQAQLDHRTHLAFSPHEIVAALNLASDNRDRDDPSVLE